LSDKLGLSQTTVSRALNGYPEVSEETRKRVESLARKLNYQPNSNARRLATGTSNTIGHVVPLSAHDMINPHFSDFIAGAGEVYNRRGYDMLISVVNADAEKAVYENLRRNRRVDGVIVHGPRVVDERMDLLRKLKLPFVVHGRTNDAEDSYSWVDVNNRRAFHRAAKYLLDAGHRRIALINGWEYMTFAAKRRQGWKRRCANTASTPDPSIMISSEMIEPTGHDTMKRFLELGNPPTAVLCSSVLTAIGATRAMHELGVKPGRDVSLIAFDDCLSFPALGERASLAMTAMQSSIRLAGKHCANMLIDLIEKKTGPRNLLLEAEFLIGASTGPVPQTGLTRIAERTGLCNCAQTRTAIKNGFDRGVTLTRRGRGLSKLRMPIVFPDVFRSAGETLPGGLRFAAALDAASQGPAGRTGRLRARGRACGRQRHRACRLRHRAGARRGDHGRRTRRPFRDRLSPRTATPRTPTWIAIRADYWQLHGLDQLAHQMTYVVIAWVAMSRSASFCRCRSSNSR
jgi:LacI family transcriptional regulator